MTKKNHHPLWDEMNYKEKRISKYGSLKKQLEYITENGLEAWQEKVAQIKSEFPKLEN